MKKLILKWLGIDTKIQSLILEWNDSLERIRDLESKCDDLKYDFESLEYNLGELEIRVDEVESIDIENLKDEVKKVISNFENKRKVGNDLIFTKTLPQSTDSPFQPLFPLLPILGQKFVSMPPYRWEKGPQRSLVNGLQKKQLSPLLVDEV